MARILITELHPGTSRSSSASFLRKPFVLARLGRAVDGPVDRAS
jgi:hypothetical protein